MSAFVVSKTHIDLLLTAGIGLSDPYGPLRWLDREPTDEERIALFPPGTAMSTAWMAWEAEHRRVLTAESAGRVGALLWAENVASVNHRYNEEQWEQPYAFEPLPHDPGAIEPLDVLDAIARYEYQSCEHPRWVRSEAYLFCTALAKRAVEALLDRRGGFVNVRDRDLWNR